jgi:hypothetical protein
MSALVIYLHRQGVAPAQIAARTGLNQAAVAGILRRMGVRHG